MAFLWSLFSKFRPYLPLFSQPELQEENSSQQPPRLDETIHHNSAHITIFGADGSPVFGEIVGAGATGWVFRISEEKVLKVPNLVTDFENEDPETQASHKHRNESILKSLENEKRVYQHLGQFKGIIPARSTDAGIEFPYIPGGTVEEYLDTHENIDLNLRSQWIKAITDVVRRVHEKHILINDFGLRNFLLNDDLSLVMIDFGNAKIIPDDMEFSDFVDRASSVKSDVASVGSLIYEIMTGRSFMVHVNLLAPFDEAESDPRHNGVDMWFPYWPPKEELADTTGVPFGDIILQCWLENGFRTMDELCGAIAAMEK